MTDMPYCCTVGEVMERQKMRKKRCASDDHRNDEDQLDEGAAADEAGEELAAMRGLVEFLELHAEGGTAVDAGGVAEDLLTKHAEGRPKEVRMGHRQTYLDRSYLHSLW